MPCPFSVGWVKRQRNPTLMLGFMLQPNLQTMKSPKPNKSVVYFLIRNTYNLV